MLKLPPNLIQYFVVVGIDPNLIPFNGITKLSILIVLFIEPRLIDLELLKIPKGIIEAVEDTEYEK